MLSLCVAIVLGAVSFGLREQYSTSLSADPATATLAKEYLLWFIPALMLQFPLVSLGAALRATGVIGPVVGLQVLSVVLNIVLAPLLIFGVGPLPRMGVSGAALATFLSILAANAMFIVYYYRRYHYLRFRSALLSPKAGMWWKILSIGVPAGAEFALISVYMAIVYGIIRQFGAAAQAGFGVGGRLMQSMFLPVIALSFAVAPVIGQNFGGRQALRVRQTFRSAIYISTSVMFLLTLIAQFAGGALIRVFSGDPSVVAFGSNYLQVISLNFIPAGIVFTSSSVFQGIGNTLPPLASSLIRLLIFAVPATVLSKAPGFQITQVWYLSVVSVLIQACANLLLLQREMRRKLALASIR